MKELVIRMQSEDKLVLEDAMAKMREVTHGVPGKRGYDDEGDVYYYDISWEGLRLHDKIEGSSCLKPIEEDRTNESFQNYVSHMHDLMIASDYNRMFSDILCKSKEVHGIWWKQLNRILTDVSKTHQLPTHSELLSMTEVITHERYKQLHELAERFHIVYRNFLSESDNVRKAVDTNLAVLIDKDLRGFLNLSSLTASESERNDNEPNGNETD